MLKSDLCYLVLLRWRTPEKFFSSAHQTESEVGMRVNIKSFAKKSPTENETFGSRAYLCLKIIAFNSKAGAP